MHPEKIRTLLVEGNRLVWSFAIHGTPGDLGNDIKILLDAMEEAQREHATDADFLSLKVAETVVGGKAVYERG
jgi:hypothetical protein